MIEQIGIALFGVTAIGLSQSERLERRKYASIFGLLGQPFWFYSAYSANQWGVFGLCVLYGGMWAKGFYTHWMKNNKNGDESVGGVRILRTSEGSLPK